ncbi:MAG: hypothetical protein A2014_01860 [Spirochaetes bacterium GWF1_49_6]|nr:MAG: hypothetical protein A2014_01860 [Spirochaetes bacterium GWF1_49_6]
MRGFLGIIGILGLISALTLILPLLEHQLVFFPEEWTYTIGHFIAGGILTGVGTVCTIILLSMKKPEAK